ncbi:hypothetical protein QVD17_18511 [Tagetes erecta]|uniref:Transmembrane protein n=1 Tax=Tagetes erecta TaxID=13708 RepID=A0AAD8KHW2_TARER|nr:hypothetical protein QVD17_18511 [Tagetes erecta]
MLKVYKGRIDEIVNIKHKYEKLDVEDEPSMIHNQAYFIVQQHKSGYLSCCWCLFSTFSHTCVSPPPSPIHEPDNTNFYSLHLHLLHPLIHIFNPLHALNQTPIHHPISYNPSVNSSFAVILYVYHQFVFLGFDFSNRIHILRFVIRLRDFVLIVVSATRFFVSQWGWRFVLWFFRLLMDGSYRWPEINTPTFYKLVVFSFRLRI